MATPPTYRLPTWATDGGADVTDPGSSKQATGWIEGEAPAADHTNWLLNNLGDWLRYIDDSKAAETVAVPWLLPEFTYDPSDELSSSNPAGIALSQDGFEIYVIGTTGTVTQYTMTESLALDTATSTDTFAATAQMTVSDDVHWSTDGTKCYILGSSTGTSRIYEYDASPAWDVGSLTYSTESVLVETQNSAMTCFTMNAAGTKLYCAGTTTNSYIYQYTLSTAFDFSDTVTYDSITLDIETEAPDSIPGIAISTDGTRMFVCGEAGETIFEFSLPTPFVLTSGSVESVSADVGEFSTNPTGIAFSASGNVLFVSDTGDDKIYRTFTNKVCSKA